MNPLYKKALIFYLVMMSMSVVLQSCCVDTYTVTTDYTIEFANLVDGTPFDIQVDTIREAFSYGLSAVIISYNSIMDDFSMMNSALAFQCGEEYVNAFKRETASLVLDKPFMLDGNVIPAGTNLFDLDEDFYADVYNAQVYEYGMTVWMKDEFLERASFPLDEYTFTTEVTLEDGSIIHDESTVVIDIP